MKQFFSIGVVLFSTGPAFSAQKVAEKISEKIAEKVIGTSGNRQVFAIELYTSEGCSSCPPADKWLSKLKDSKDLWVKHVPLAFHVDYWNKLGWKDGMSSQEMTQRQVDVSQTWPSPRVYTPGIAINGKEVPNWPSQPLPTYQSENPIQLTLLKTPDGTFTVKLEGTVPDQPLVIRFAILGMGIDSNVTSGENQGLKLKHDFVVLDWQKTGVGSLREFKFDARKIPQKTSQLAAVAWIERANNPSPLQITGGYL